MGGGRADLISGTSEEESSSTLLHCLVSSGQCTSVGRAAAPAPPAQARRLTRSPPPMRKRPGVLLPCQRPLPAAPFHTGPPADACASSVPSLAASSLATCRVQGPAPTAAVSEPAAIHTVRPALQELWLQALILVS